MARPSVREQIISAGLDTLHRSGFNASSVQDITDAAGVPKGSFYNHFESKETLGAEAVLKYVEGSRPRLAVLRDTKLAPLSRLRAYFEDLCLTFEQSRYSRGCLLGNFGAELSDQSPLIRDRVARAFASWSEIVAKVVAEAQAAGTVSTDFPPEVLAALVINGWEGALLRAKVDKSRVPLDQFLAVTFAKVLA
jgi:TetR/AcrR family transcriptional regulator, transcriptional repressor for nem operon